MGALDFYFVWGCCLWTAFCALVLPCDFGLLLRGFWFYLNSDYVDALVIQLVWLPGGLGLLLSLLLCRGGIFCCLGLVCWSFCMLIAVTWLCG